MFFASSLGLGAFIAIPDRVRIFGYAKVDWTVMTEFALVAPDKLEKEQYTRSIQPSQRHPAGAVNFAVTAVRALLSPIFKHNGNVVLLFDLRLFSAIRQSAFAFDPREGSAIAYSVLPGSACV